MNARQAVRAPLPIVRNEPLGGDGRLITFELPAHWPASQPGQFLMLHLGGAGVVRHDPLLPRPMAVYRERPGELDVLYEVVGRGTALLAGFGPGDVVLGVGPLGRPFPLPEAGETALLVGGGTGIASLHELARASAARGPVTVLLGARSAVDLHGRAEFEALDGVALAVATDDGSAGYGGLVTDLLERALRDARTARVYACGPTPMMQRAAEIAQEAGAPCVVSLENRMACGFGVCLGCAVRSSGGGFRLVCRDGPVFDARELALEALP